MRKNIKTKKRMRQLISQVLGHEQWTCKELEGDENDLMARSDKVHIHCDIHDYDSFQLITSFCSPSRLKTACFCPFCQDKIVKQLTLKLIKKECENKGLHFITMVEGDQTEDLDKVKAKEYFWVQCNRGHEPYKTSWDAIIHEHGCPKCATEDLGLSSRTPEEKFKEKFESMNCTYQRVEYQNKKAVLFYRCNKHPDIEQKILLSNLINRCGCAFCNMSKREKKIIEYCKKNNILFEPQKTFSECKNIKPLPFDFYLPEYNICIEYQGEQHYQLVRFGNRIDSEQDLKDRQERDKIKKDFCKQNNISLLEIPYWDYKKIEQILEDFLNERNKL